MNSLKFIRGAVCYAQLGILPENRIYFRITDRKNNIIRLKELKTVEVDGNWVPGDINPEGQCIWRKVKMVDNAEYGAPYSAGGINSWIRLLRKPRGGKRKGAGRKPGGGKGRVQQSRSICLSAADWEKFDRLRGKTPRGKFVLKLLAEEELRQS